ncbi:MAG: GAF and ANTAR domain-containing protein [Acidimicrobiia bacterium]
MPDDPLLRILARWSSDDGRARTTRLCAVCAEITEMSGAGIMLMADDAPRGSVCSTNDVSALIEELQYTFGEGPCVDAYRQQRPIVEPDLADPASPRWTAFSRPAVEAGARAVFGFPITIGAARLGALNLYRDSTGPLTNTQHTDALVLSGVAARAIIAMQAGAAPGDLGSELQTGTNFQFVVHQAAGMVAVQIGVPVADALVRLRAHAFSHDRLVADVARDVVSGQLRFDDADDHTDPP